ncbi:DUF6415 family natural product biosynthesis protein [Streptomyces sp. NPDC010273]|uniref:DUF6415 family natural product biosynthesis protein n=1 Tax=Streptomyces sp. NPDC010273 TaxID=3364829 RepID=UPI0036DFEAEB
MPNATAPPPSTTDTDQLPPDVMAMLASIAPVLAEDIPRADPSDPDSRDAPERRFTRAELVALAGAFREHLRELVPAVEAWAEQLPESHADRVAAMLCAGQARILLRPRGAESTATDALCGSTASRLARMVRTLCGHYDRLVPR